uniref:Uncharacterized protein n=1 Tax=Auxenochlorella protothecoides TaxID=3075 RepID=A0A1D1ZUY0_AUXPR
MRSHLVIHHLQADLPELRDIQKQQRAVAVCLSAECDPQPHILRSPSPSPLPGAGLGHIPRLSLGRDRFNIPQGSGAGQAEAPVRALSPEAVEVARRTYVAGLRALVYGTLLGFGALALAGTYVAQAMELGQPGADAGRSVRSALEPTTRRLRDGAARLRAALGGWAARESGESEPRSEFQQRMMARYNPGSLGGRVDGEFRAPGREWREP